MGPLRFGRHVLSYAIQNEAETRLVSSSNLFLFKIQAEQKWDAGAKLSQFN